MGQVSTGLLLLLVIVVLLNDLLFCCYWTAVDLPVTHAASGYGHCGSTVSAFLLWLYLSMTYAANWLIRILRSSWGQSIPIIYAFPLHRFHKWVFLHTEFPSGVISEYVNPNIPTQIPKEYWSDPMWTPGWQPTLCVAWCLIWWFASLEIVWSYMTPNVVTETSCH